ncbi:MULTISPECIES: hypothetical protein [Morganellaceae]|uniref:hypothetical protein n=1 Tax=Morganellaceae TaxID=1903414 RepID=UPI00298C9A34|nr:hypothetical protein [Proteus terrae]WPD00553.1 hypothetical protein R5P25_08610 [Proteus terrae]
MTKTFKPTKPGHAYRVTFGVNQTVKINKAANLVNETPQDFLKKSALGDAQKLIDADNAINRK